jgi:Zn finger protein HypA/HybF involved in hydrogenase expression
MCLDPISYTPPSVQTRTCIDCGVGFVPAAFDALCPTCRAEQTARDLERTVCPRCKRPMTPARFRLVCPDCSTKDLLDQVARYGNE